MREVDAAVIGVGALALRTKDVEVVAADAAQEFRPARVDLVALRSGEAADEVGDRAFLRTEFVDWAER